MNSLSEDSIVRILRFRDEREWKQFHSPKDLAISINLEAAELLELFQWSASNTSAEGKTQELSEELADVLIYSVMLADYVGLDLNDIVQRKLERNAKKYPIEQAHGNARKYTTL